MSDTSDKRPPAASTLEVRVPDLGNFKDVAVLDVLVKVGDQVEKETAAADARKRESNDRRAVPGGRDRGEDRGEGRRQAQYRRHVHGDRRRAAGSHRRQRGEGHHCRRWWPAAPEATDCGSCEARGGARGTSTAKTSRGGQGNRVDAHAAPSKTYDFDVVVLGAGPGGYTAAFRAADLGLKVALVERWPMLGGVCLNVGCIPSKALLHAAKVIEEARAMADFGVSFGAPSVDAEKLRRWKNKIVTRLTGGLTGLAKQRKVTVLRGVGSFASDHTVNVTPDTGSPQTVSFAHCIIAVGSESMRLARITRRSAHHRFDRRAGTRASWLPAGRGRRHHRSRDGDGLRGARCQSQRRRTHRGPDARLRSRPRQATREADHATLRTHHAAHEGHHDRCRKERAARDVRG